MKVIAFANQKGGAGKTTLTHNFVRTLAAGGYRVLMVDADPQANLTESFLEDTSQVKARTFDLYQRRGALVEPHVLTDRTALFAGDDELAMIEHTNDIDVFEFIREGVAPLAERFDFCVIDTPPSLGFLAISTYVAAQYMVVPLNPDTYSFSATARLLQKVGSVKTRWNPELTILGAVLNNVKPGTNLLDQALRELKEAFGEALCPIPIPSSVRFPETAARHVSILDHAPDTSVAKAFDQLVTELMKRLGMTRKKAGVPAVGKGSEEAA
jgi:chromosome partitioning protein